MVVLVMGVSGSGKTTVGKALARVLQAAFYDADDYHPPANVEKMRRGIPLTDADREPWLRAVREIVDVWLGRSAVAVLACSALTKRIRRRLGTDREGVRVVHLTGNEALLAERMRTRGHFMPAQLLQSQLELLEPPADAVVLDARKPVEELVAEARRRLGL